MGDGGVTTYTRPLPASLPARVHRDTGLARTSWTGELRAVVDGDQLVIRVWSARLGWVYRVEWRYSWEEGWIQEGPLPKKRGAAKKKT